MEEVKCPYCEKYVEINVDDFYEGHQEFECPNCSKNFEVFAEPSVNYTPGEKAECLNGGEHDWKLIKGVPEIHFWGRYRCKNCSARKSIDEELATQEQWDAYFKKDVK